MTHEGGYDPIIACLKRGNTSNEWQEREKKPRRLRHAYENLIREVVGNQKAFVEGLIAPR
jgi:hypothetical protein